MLIFDPLCFLILFHHSISASQSNEPHNTNHILLVYHLLLTLTLSSIPVHVMTLSSIPVHVMTLSSIPVHAMTLSSIPVHVMTLSSIPVHVKSSQVFVYCVNVKERQITY